MIKTISKSLTVNLTTDELKSYFEKFGLTFWNDNEDIICIPISDLARAKEPNESLLQKYYTFFGIGYGEVDNIIIFI
jgi:hypothetical protein